MGVMAVWRAFAQPLRYAALGAGALPILAFPQLNLEFLGWCGLVPGILIMRGAPSAREAAVRGWWLGAGFFLAALYWLVPNIGPALLLVAVVFGALGTGFGVAAWALLRAPLRPARALAALAVLPGYWVFTEWARSWQGFGGPWDVLGTSQWQHPAVLALAAVGGVWLISFALVAANTGIAILLLARGMAVRAAGAAGLRRGAGRRAGGLCPQRRRAAGPARHGGAGPAREHEQQEPAGGREPAAVRAAPRRPPGPDRLGREQRRHRHRPPAGAAAADQAAGRGHRRPGAGEPGRVPAGWRAIEGGPADRAAAASPARTPRRGWSRSASTSRCAARSAGSPRISQAASSNMVPGDGAHLIQATDRLGRPLPLGVLICFESAFPDMSRVNTDLGAQLIVYQTSDSTFQRSWAPAQHASLSAVRAAETGRPVVQAALTGDTVAFDARGRLLALMPAQQRGVTVVRLGLPPAAARTLYDRLGDYVPWAATGIAALAAITGFLMVRRARGGRVPWDGNPRRARSVSTVGASSGKCREGQH